VHHGIDEPGGWKPINVYGGKMENDLYTVNRRAGVRFLDLDPAARTALDAAIRPLVDLSEKDWPAQGAIRLGQIEKDRPGPTFMLKLGPSLRAFVRPTPGGKPEVLDFIHQETIDWVKSLDSTHEPSAPVEAGQLS
jgi:hypothetical protein